jgi:hypothetical protein
MGNLCNIRGDNYVSAKTFSRKDFLGIKTHSILNDYNFEKMLGLGAYGEVRLGLHKRSKR